MRVVPLYRHEGRHPQARICSECGVRSLSLFGTLADDELDAIHTHIANIELSPAELLFDAGEPGQALYSVRSGVLRFERVTARGDRRIVRLAGAGELIGQEVMLQRTHADTVVACTPVQACRIPRPLLDDLAADHPQLLRDLMLRWQQALEGSEQWLADLATGPAQRRLLYLLLKLQQLAGPGQPIWMPRRDEMGAMLDLTVETASRFVSRLRRQGLLKALGPRSSMLDPQRLQAALQALNAT